MAYTKEEIREARKTRLPEGLGEHLATGVKQQISVMPIAADFANNGPSHQP